MSIVATHGQLTIHKHELWQGSFHYGGLTTYHPSIVGTVTITIEREVQIHSQPQQVI